MKGRPMTISDLSAGTYFHFVGSDTVWLARGNYWYASPGGYDGGPWTAHPDAEVTLYECPGCGENTCPGCYPVGQNLNCFV